jgi:hypothetical protein
VDQAKPARFASLFLPAQRIAELGARRALGLVAREPGFDQRVCTRVEVELPFLVHLALDAPPNDERRQKRSNPRREPHTSSGTAPSAALIASESRSQ